jgi:hypothetical protein
VSRAVAAIQKVVSVKLGRSLPRLYRQKSRSSGPRRRGPRRILLSCPRGSRRICSSLSTGIRSGPPPSWTSPSRARRAIPAGSGFWSVSPRPTGPWKPTGRVREKSIQTRSRTGPRPPPKISSRAPPGIPPATRTEPDRRARLMLVFCSFRPPGCGSSAPPLVI